MGDKSRYVLTADDIVKSEFLNKRNAEALLAGLNASGATKQLAVDVGGSGVKSSDLTDGKLLYYSAARKKFMSSGLNHNVVVSGGEVGVDLDYPGPVMLSSAVSVASGSTGSPTSFTTVPGSTVQTTAGVPAAARFIIVEAAVSQVDNHTAIVVRAASGGIETTVVQSGSGTASEGTQSVTAQAIVPLHSDSSFQYKLAITTPSGAGTAVPAWSIKIIGYYAAATANTNNLVFSSVPAAVPALSATLEITHGLGYQPGNYRLVLYCQTGEFGYSTGDEVAFNDVNQNNNGHPHFQVRVDATKFYVLRRSAGASEIMRKDSGSEGVYTAWTEANWRIKAYWTHTDGSVNYVLTAGAVRQTVQAVKSTAEFITAGAVDWVTIADLNKPILLQSAGSKVRVQAVVHVGGRANLVNPMRITRSINGGAYTAVGINTDSGLPAGVYAASGHSSDYSAVYSLSAVVIDYIDAPAVSGLVTYRIELLRFNGAHSYINRAEFEGSGYAAGRTISTLTLSELIG